MNALQYEIQTLTETSPGVVTSPDWDDFTEIAFKDAGSRRAAMVAVKGFGALVALRSARTRTVEAGQAFTTDGSSPKSNWELKNVAKRITSLSEVLDSVEFANTLGASGVNGAVLERQDADLLIDCMEATADLAAPGKPDAVSYYAAVIPTLLNEAVLSADQGRFRYEI
jgi:hypothetical protein